jgi:hypothetical protein
LEVKLKTKGRFPEQLAVCAPPGFNAALAALADKQHRTKTEVARQAILKDLEANGVKLGAEPDRVPA